MKANELELTDSQGLYNAVSKPTTEEVTETFIKVPARIGITDKYATNRVNIGYPARIVELTPNTVYKVTPSHLVQIVFYLVFTVPVVLRQLLNLSIHYLKTNLRYI